MKSDRVLLRQRNALTGEVERTFGPMSRQEADAMYIKIAIFASDDFFADIVDCNDSEERSPKTPTDR